MDKIFEIPKVVLHDHLDGGLRVATVIEIAKKYNIKLPRDGEFKLSQWFYEEFSSKDFSRCFKPFELTCAVMQTEDAIERVAFEFLEDHALSNVIYAEARFCPYFHTSKGLPYSQIINSISRGFTRAKQKYNIESGILVCGMYNLDDSTNIEMAKLYLEFEDVVGFDFAGMDINGKISQTHPKTIKFLNDNSISFTTHSGEFSNIENIRDSIQIGTSRIGHGCNLYKTNDLNILQETIDLIKEKNIHIESNVTSNLALGMVDKFENHPYQKMLKDGISVALNTDDRLMLNNLNITDEYSQAYAKNRLPLESIVQMNLSAAKAAFISDIEKQKAIIEKIQKFASKNL